MTPTGTLPAEAVTGSAGPPDHAPRDQAPRDPWRSIGRGVWTGVTTVARAITSPLVPDDAIGLVNPLLSGADLYGRIVSITPATADAAHVRIRPGRGWRGHVPGQYIRVGVDVDGVRHWRAYSLTNGAGERDVEITVKRIPDGIVSHHLNAGARPGDVVLLDQATGEFTLDPTAVRRPLFVTAGSGITPVMGMLRHHVDDMPGTTLVHSAPTASDVIFGDELRALAASGRLEFVERHTDIDGWLTPADLDALVPDWRDRHVWLCGPTAMLDAFEAHFADAGLASQLHTERFRARLVEPGDGGSITFLTTGLTVEADGATPILDAGEDAGVLLPSGCRMGICYNCSSTLVEGSVRDLRSGVVTVVDPVQEPQGALVQTCVHAAAGACTLLR